MKVKVPTMRELKRSARKVRADVDEGHADNGDDAIFVIDAMNVPAYFGYIASHPGSRSRARYLAGRHIEALKEMEEVGL